MMAFYVRINVQRIKLNTYIYYLMKDLESNCENKREELLLIERPRLYYWRGKIRMSVYTEI